MRCSDVIDVTDTTRRHVGSILNMSKDCYKCGNLIVQLLNLFGAFRLAHNSIHKHK